MIRLIRARLRTHHSTMNLPAITSQAPHPVPLPCRFQGLKEAAQAARPRHPDQPQRDMEQRTGDPRCGWPDAKRGVPNEALRSALLPAVCGNRRDLEGELGAAQEGIEIRFTGKQLKQSDLI